MNTAMVPKTSVSPIAFFMASSLFLPAAGDAGDEILRSFGEQVEFHPLQRLQRRCEVRIGDPLAQQRNGALVLGTGETRGSNLQAGIAEEAMDDFAHRLAG